MTLDISGNINIYLGINETNFTSWIVRVYFELMIFRNQKINIIFIFSIV